MPIKLKTLKRITKWIWKPMTRRTGKADLSEDTDQRSLGCEPDYLQFLQLKVLADPSLPELPKNIQQEILSFIYDDSETIKAISECKDNSCFDQITPDSLQQHIGHNILNSASTNDIFCLECKDHLTYPYRLMDCGHIVCGLCAWHVREAISSCRCGVRLRSRPRRLNPKLADARAKWLLGEEENEGRLKRNERHVLNRVPRGGGSFGTNGISSPISPFQFVGFESDFDYLDVLDIRDDDFDLQVKSILPVDCKRLHIVLCPAHENYHPYVIEDGRSFEFDFYSIAHRAWLRSISNEDMVVLEEWTAPKNARRERFEIRLTGWEAKVGVGAEYDY